MQAYEKEKLIAKINSQMDIFDDKLANAIPKANVDEDTRFILDLIAQQSSHAFSVLQEAVIAILEDK